MQTVQRKTARRRLDHEGGDFGPERKNGSWSFTNNSPKSRFNSDSSREISKVEPQYRNTTGCRQLSERVQSQILLIPHEAERVVALWSNYRSNLYFNNYSIQFCYFLKRRRYPEVHQIVPVNSYGGFITTTVLPRYHEHCREQVEQ